MVKLVKRAPPAAKRLRSNHDLAIELSSNEGMAESHLVVAQNLWGEANLGPQDSLFATTAIMALTLTPASAFSVVARNLSGRLTRLSEETGFWVDAYELEPIRFSLDRRKGAKIKRNVWQAGALPQSKYTDLFVHEPARLTAGLDALYAECAASLRDRGHLFIADMVLDGATAQTIESARLGQSRRWCTQMDHLQALSQSRLKVQQQFEMTRDLMVAVRDGFLKGIGRIPDIRALELPWRSQRLSGFLVELEHWFKLYKMLEHGQVSAIGFLTEKT